MKILSTMSHYYSIKTAWSESFGMQKPLWHRPNLESTQIKLRLTTCLMRIVCYQSYETCWRFWSASVCWNSFQRWQQIEAV